MKHDHCGKNDAIAKAIAAEPYLKERKASIEADQQLYLKGVSFSCPLCGSSLRHRQQKKQIRFMRLPIFSEQSN